MHHYCYKYRHMSAWWGLHRHICVHVVGTCHYADGLLLVPVCLHPLLIWPYQWLARPDTICYCQFDS